MGPWLRNPKLHKNGKNVTDSDKIDMFNKNHKKSRFLEGNQ